MPRSTESIRGHIIQDGQKILGYWDCIAPTPDEVSIETVSFWKWLGEYNSQGERMNFMEVKEIEIPDGIIQVFKKLLAL